MEQPEPPGIIPPDHAPLRRFPRLLPPPNVRQITPVRRIQAIMILLGVATAVIVTQQVIRGIMGYVDHLPAYRTSYRDIELDPPPPRWYRGGSERFLKQALGNAPDLQEFSVLQSDKEQILTLLRRYPWTLRATKAVVGEKHRVIVSLGYREPVAVEGRREPSEGNRGGVYVDRDGYILPRDDIDVESAGRVISLFGFTPPVDPRPGESWNQAGATKGLVVKDARVAEAASLASFIRNSLVRDKLEGNPSFKSVAIHSWLTDGTYVQVGVSMFLWNDPGDRDLAAALPREERWRLLANWVGEHPNELEGSSQYLRFTKAGVERENRFSKSEQPDSTLPYRPAKSTKAKISPQL